MGILTSVRFIMSWEVASLLVFLLKGIWIVKAPQCVSFLFGPQFGKRFSGEVWVLILLIGV